MSAITTSLPVYTQPIHMAAPAKSIAPQGLNEKGLNQKAWAAAKDFEAQFLSSMLQPMFEGIKSDGPFDGGQGEQMFRSLLVDQYAQQMTQSGGVGVSQQIYREILKLQEQA